MPLLLAATEPLFAPPDLRPLAREVFSALATARFATVRSLLSYAGPSGLTRELLAAWADAGLLHAASVRPDAVSTAEVPYVALTTKGARELERVVLRPVRGESGAALRRSAQTRAHDLAAGDVALAVLALARDGVIDLLGVDTRDERFGTSAVIELSGDGPVRVALQADLYLAVRQPTGPSGLLVEVDRGTVSVERMARKYGGYLAWRRAGGPERDFGLRSFRVLTLAPDDRRLHKLHDAALAAHDGKRSGFLLFAKLDDATPQDAARLCAPVAHALGSPAERLPVFVTQAVPFN